MKIVSYVIEQYNLYFSSKVRRVQDSFSSEGSNQQQHQRSRSGQSLVDDNKFSGEVPDKYDMSWGGSSREVYDVYKYYYTMTG